jgi:hypothetical protein
MDYMGDNVLSIVITIPKSTPWALYEKELERAEQDEILNFRVSNFPKSVQPGDKCYIVHDGYIRGWMYIVGFTEKRFICTTTHGDFEGKFIERSGKFHELSKPIPCRGFQGFKYCKI